MRHFLLLAVMLGAACCDPAEKGAPTPIASKAGTVSTKDDGTFLARIDPLGGQWSVERIGDEGFQRFKGWVNFSAGGFLNHGAGCSGGFPAFYRLDGTQITVIRREAARIGKCASATAADRAAAAASERRLTDFLDQAASWDRLDDRTLVLTARDGTRALLTRPVERHPELAGRWIIQTIGGQPLVTERRPPTLSISMDNIGVHADCNGMGAPFTIPAPGRIKVTGPIVGTAIGCAPEDAAEDDLMAKAMTAASAYRLEGDRLTFTGGPGMVVRRPPAPDRRLAGEYEACGNTLLGAYHEGPITLAVDEHTMRDNAECVAEYSADGPELTLRLGNSPACAAQAPPYVPGEPISVGGKVSTLAATRPNGFGFDEQGRLILRTRGGLLSMCRKGSPPPFGG